MALVWVCETCPCGWSDEICAHRGPITTLHVHIHNSMGIVGNAMALHDAYSPLYVMTLLCCVP